MTRTVWGAIALGMSIFLIVACGNESLLLPQQHREVADLQIQSIPDGQILFAGDTVPLQIAAADTQRSRDLDVVITVYSLTHDKLWENRITSPALNEALPPLRLPSLGQGQYRMEISLLSSGDEVQKTSTVFFASPSKVRIAGIKSYPAVITTASPVLLKAELDNPDKIDPYFRWSLRGRAIGEGLASEGYGQVLWTAPDEEGIDTISLEFFPIAPAADTDSSVHSSVTMSTDIYVSVARGPSLNELGSEKSYSTLLHMQASLKDSEQAAPRSGRAAATFIGASEIVPTDEGFGYRLSRGTGIRIPWFVLPLENGSLQPFTVSLGIRIEGSAGEDRILSVKSGDFSFSIALAKDSLSPQLTLSAPGVADLVVPSSAVMQKDQRYLLSVSMAPQTTPAGYTFQWFLDGEQTNVVASTSTLPSISGEGEAVLGGEKGFSGVVDEFGVYSRDENGNPSTDPGLYHRVAEKEYKDALVLAEGFDGTTIPNGFALNEKGKLANGFVELPAGTGLTLPPLEPGDDGIEFSITLPAGTAQSATLGLWWEGAKTHLLDMPAAARAGELRFSFKADTLTVQGTGDPKTAKVTASEERAKLVIAIGNPADAKLPLVVDRILVVHQK